MRPALCSPPFGRVLKLQIAPEPATLKRKLKTNSIPPRGRRNASLDRRLKTRRFAAGASSVILVLVASGFAPSALSQNSDAPYRWAKDIQYRTSETAAASTNERCRLDLYYPASTNGYATVVWFHGGGLTGGNRSVPKALQDRGIAVAAASYRLSPQVKAPVYIEDAAAAVAWTFRHIADYGGSTNRIFVSGHSAAGYLTAMIGLDKRWLSAHGIDANRIAGLVPMSPQAITHFTIRAERGISDKQPLLDEYAPLFHVRKDAPPMLLLTGDREKELLGRYEENAYFWRMMKVVGHQSTELRELPGFDHGKMAEPGFPLLLQFMAQWDIRQSQP